MNRLRREHVAEWRHHFAFGLRLAVRDYRQQFRVVRILDGDTLVLRPETGGAEATVRLLGVDAPDPPSGHWCNQAITYLTNRTRDRLITLRLDGLEPRDADGNVLAYVYITEKSLLNAEMIRDGQAYADRRRPHSMRLQFEQLETEARKKPRGLWKDVTELQMPRWRQDWLRAWREQRNSR